MYALWGRRVLFAVYLAGLCYFLLFAETYGRIFGQEIYRYNLVPFKEIKRFWRYREELGIHSLYNLAGNVLIFLPAGFFIPGLWKQRKGILFTACLTFEISFLIETLQLILRVGSFDVDDLLLNTLGGVLGCLIMMLMKQWRNHEKT